MHLQSQNINTLVTRSLTGFVYGTIFWTIFLYLPPLFFSIFLILVFAIIIATEWPKMINVSSIAGALLTIVYLLVPLSLMIWANHTDHINLGVLFALVMIHDTCAYLAGLCFGKNLMCPTISPKKTWQGFIGGMLSVLVSLAFLKAMGMFGGPRFIVIGFGLFFTLIATLGDLFESWLKRQSHIKDSGTSLPGHGGFLDRFDSTIFIIVMYYALRAILYLL